MAAEAHVDELARQFLDSDYVSDLYSRWSLDQRLSAFLRRSGHARVDDDGDLFNVILDRVMTGISSVAETESLGCATRRHRLGLLRRTFRLQHRNSRPLKLIRAADRRAGPPACPTAIAT